MQVFISKIESLLGQRKGNSPAYFGVGGGDLWVN